MTSPILSKLVFSLVFSSLGEKVNFREVLLSWIPRKDRLVRRFSLVRFLRINHSEHNPRLLEHEAIRLLEMFDIEGIFESHEEAALFLQSIGKNPVPISDALDHRNGAVERIIDIPNSPTKPLELGFYGTFRPENSLEIPTLLPVCSDTPFTRKSTNKKINK